MQTAADEASELLKALANRHRLLIVCQLIEQERSVGELAEFLDIRNSTVSQHLALLRKDGLVDRAPRRPDHLVFDRQRAGARTGPHALSRLLRAGGGLRAGAEAQQGGARRAAGLRQINDRPVHAREA